MHESITEYLKAVWIVILWVEKIRKGFLVLSTFSKFLQFVWRDNHVLETNYMTYHINCINDDKIGKIRKKSLQIFLNPQIEKTSNQLILFVVLFHTTIKFWFSFNQSINPLYLQGRRAAWDRRADASKGAGAKAPREVQVQVQVQVQAQVSLSPFPSFSYFYLFTPLFTKHNFQLSMSFKKKN